MERIKIFFDKYESYLSSGTLVAGFIFDFLTLHRVDVFWDNFFIVLYVLLSGFSIILINLYDEGRLKGNFFDGLYEFLPFTLQFSFGGLFSAFVIFYSKSASFFTSGVFIFALVFLLIGNEFFKERYQKLVFQLGIYFVSVFSFLIFLIPVLFKRMGDGLFILSGVSSLVFISLFAFALSKFSPLRFEENRKYLALTVMSLFVVINIMYFTNIIPPIPLAMKTGEVYHSVSRNSDGTYLVTGEVDRRWYKKLITKTVYVGADEPLYVFSSVFAPTDLNTTIFHDWQYYNESQKKWLSVTRIPFKILGGRGNGYRVFSKKENIFNGKWRVDVESERGQVIGRIRFNIESGSPVLESSTM